MPSLAAEKSPARSGREYREMARRPLTFNEVSGGVRDAYDIFQMSSIALIACPGTSICWPGTARKWRLREACRFEEPPGQGHRCSRRRVGPGKHEISLSSGPASGVAGDRGDDLAGVERPKRSAVSATPASSSSGVVPAQREGSGAAIPGHGKGRSALRLPWFAHWAALGGMTAPPLRNLSR